MCRIKTFILNLNLKSLRPRRRIRPFKTLIHGDYFSLQNYSLPGLSLFESVLDAWVMCGKQTRCSRQFSGPFVPPGAPFYLGTSTVSDGHGGYV